MSVATPQETLPLSAQLKQETAAQHERLDKRIMALSPFADRGRFTRFARMQTRLSLVTAPLYGSAECQRWLPSLADDDRLAKVLADCRDLGVTEAELAEDVVAANAVPTPQGRAALGWIYTQEGSSMGAAILFRIAREQLGLSETFGARHLAGQPEGRARYWRSVTADLDALKLDEQCCDCWRPGGLRFCLSIG